MTMNDEFSLTSSFLVFYRHFSSFEALKIVFYRHPQRLWRAPETAL